MDEAAEVAPGMPFEEAISLAREIRAVQWWRVTGLADRAYHPEQWRILVRYQPRKPNGTSDGAAVGRWIASREDWQAVRVLAVELNARNQRSAATRAARKRQAEQEQEQET